jgi:glycosyltransferase involved in cell wall biosynthesis
MTTPGATSDGREGDVDLTIVIPCLNEEDNIRLVLDELRVVLRNRPFASEIVVVDDLSEDRTFAVAAEWANSAGQDFRVSVVKRPLHRRGYGAAVRYGVAYGVGRYAIFVSADGVDPINLLPTMYEKMEEGFAVAQCSRYLRASDAATIPFKYKFFQFFFRIGVRIAIGQEIVDSTYAFKMFRRREMLGVGLTQNRFNVSPEIMFKSILGGGRVAYIPGAQGTRRRGVSKFVFRKEGIGFGYCLVRALLHRHKLIYWF